MDTLDPANTVLMARVLNMAKSGVDYDARDGARCPVCGQRSKVVTSRPWQENIKVRYHVCQNEYCPFHISNTQFKSIQIVEP